MTIIRDFISVVEKAHASQYGNFFHRQKEINNLTNLINPTGLSIFFSTHFLLFPEKEAKSVVPLRGSDR
jgi:hypothetical protein